MYESISISGCLLMFFDLKVQRESSEVDTLATLNTLIELGYSGCAYSVHFPSVKHAKPNTFKTNSNLLAYLTSLKNDSNIQPFKQLSRIDIDLYENAEVNQLSSKTSILNSYDIVAVCPKTDKVFQSACKSSDIDIISLTFSEKMPFFIKSAAVNLALAKGITFEIQYSDALKDSSSRKYFITNASQLVKATRGKFICVSSGAKDRMELRGPYDVINLAGVLELNQVLAKKAMVDTTLHVLYHSVTRTDTYKGAISAEVIPPNQEVALVIPSKEDVALVV